MSIFGRRPAFPEVPTPSFVERFTEGDIPVTVEGWINRFEQNLANAKKQISFKTEQLDRATLTSKTFQYQIRNSTNQIETWLVEFTEQGYKFKF